MSVDVVVVGGGIVGLSAARALAGQGARTVLLERGPRPGAEASSAAAGMLAAQAEAEDDSPTLRLELAARDRYPEFLRGLERETGFSVPLSAPGHLHVALDAAQEERLRARFERQRALGLEAELWGPDRVRGSEPRLSRAARLGLWVPRDGRVDNVTLVSALAEAVARGLARLRTGAAVEGLAVEGGRVVGVRVAGEILRTQTVVNAAGAWSARLAGDPAPPPVEPVRGQIVAFAAGVPLLGRVAWSGRPIYLVPTADGRILAGSTLERAGFDASVTREGVAAIRAGAAELLPDLAAATVAETWAGLRPGSPDGAPILGAGAVPGLIHATGLYRGGVLLGPLVGEIAAALALGRDPGFDLAPFDPGRFR